MLQIYWTWWNGAVHQLHQRFYLMEYGILMSGSSPISNQSSNTHGIMLIDLLDVLHYKQYSHQPWLPNKDGQLLAGEQMLLVSFFFYTLLYFYFWLIMTVGKTEERGSIETSLQLIIHYHINFQFIYTPCTFQWFVWEAETLIHKNWFHLVSYRITR